MTRFLRILAFMLGGVLAAAALGVMAARATPPLLDPTVFAQGPSASPVRLVPPYRVTVGASAVQLTASGNVHALVLKAICPGQTIYIGADATVTTSTGYPMSDGETLTLEVRNANQIFAIASAASQSVSVLPYERY